MNKEEVDKFCKEYYGFTLEDADGSIGYWMSKYQELEQEYQHLQNNWNELKKWLEDEITKLRDFPLQDVERVAKRISLERTLKKLNKMAELERGEE